MNSSYPSSVLSVLVGQLGARPASVLFSGQPEIWVEFIHGIPSPVLAVSPPVFPIYSPVVMVAPNSFL